MTQIKRIRYLIYLLVQFQYLESISSFKFLPWTTIPYSIEISKLSKELEAENHKNSAILLAPNQYSVYTNSSELVDQKGIGIGLTLFNSNQELIQGSSWNIEISQLVYNGELIGIAEGIKLISKIAQKNQEFTIYLDNQTTLQRLKSLSDKPGQNQVILVYEANREIVRKRAKIKLAWVPSYFEVPDNKKADLLIKSGTKILLVTQITSFNYLETRIKRIKSQE
jgi:ribonuclease HI